MRLVESDLYPYFVKYSQFPVGNRNFLKKIYFRKYLENVLMYFNEACFELVSK